jgi:hypothetical protein
MHYDVCVHVAVRWCCQTIAPLRSQYHAISATLADAYSLTTLLHSCQALYTTSNIDQNAQALTVVVAHI